MTMTQPSVQPSAGALKFQDDILPLVSRTFALTIPQLPATLGVVVANAYLLCRMADTIEDDPGITPENGHRLQQQFADLVEAGEGDIPGFIADVIGQLSNEAPPAEVELLRHTAEVLAVTVTFGTERRQALSRCLRIMCDGMRDYQQRASRNGLQDLPDLDRYCYYVAGVVGEMLTELFCAHSPEVAARRETMMRLALSFGQGLQMTNILKDIWEDYSRGVCWLPASVMARHGFSIGEMARPRSEPAQAAFTAGLHELIGVAHAHLRNAMEYTLMIPPEERGIRRFCAWAIGMAVLTIERIALSPEFSQGKQVKITRKAVAQTMFLTRIGIGSDAWLRWLFNRAARRLPLTPLSAGWDGFVPFYPPASSCKPALEMAISK